MNKKKKNHFTSKRHLPRCGWHLARSPVATERHGTRGLGTQHPPQQRGHGGHEVLRKLARLVLVTEHLGKGHGQRSGAQRVHQQCAAESVETETGINWAHFLGPTFPDLECWNHVGFPMFSTSSEGTQGTEGEWFAPALGPRTWTLAVQVFGDLERQGLQHDTVSVNSVLAASQERRYSRSLVQQLRLG